MFALDRCVALTKGNKKEYPHFCCYQYLSEPVLVLTVSKHANLLSLLLKEYRWDYWTVSSGPISFFVRSHNVSHDLMVRTRRSIHPKPTTTSDASFLPSLPRSFVSTDRYCTCFGTPERSQNPSAPRKTRRNMLLPWTMAPPSKRQRWSFFGMTALFTLGLLLLVIFSVRQEQNSMEYTTSNTDALVRKDYSETSTILQLPTHLEGCTIGEATVTEPQSSSTLKPFWVPSYPAADNGLFAPLVVALTGNVASYAKNYYASSPTLKKCFSRGGGGGNQMTITCQQLHPIVGIGPLPEKQVDKFQPRVIMPLRNPLTGAPEHYQQKAVLYHGATQQVPVSDWRAYRDEWLQQTIVSEWNSVVTTWKDMKEYQGIALYVPLEHVLDVQRGPLVVEELATLLRQAGFPVIPASDVHCAWYRVTKSHIQAAIDRSAEDKISTPQALRYPFATEYIPGYTAQQKAYIITELHELQQRYPDDTVLLSILQEYILEIQETKVNDIMFVDDVSKNSTIP
jgi:hypothetical protein